MKLIYLLLIPFLIFSQDVSLDEISKLGILPDDIKNGLDKGDEEDNEISDQKKLLDQKELKEDIECQDDNFEVFGYDFFACYDPLLDSPVLDLPLNSDYEITFGDKLELYIGGLVDEYADLIVDLSGNVMLPKYGYVSLVGLKLSEAKLKLSKIISDSYTGAEAFLSVKQPSLKKVSVIGLVKNPDTYFMNPFVTVSQAIKYAGGLEDNASLRAVTVKDYKGNTKVLDLYEYLIKGNRTVDLNLNNGDTVLVGPSKSYVPIIGEVIRSKTYEYLPSDRFQDLLSFALGLTKEGDSNKLFANVLEQGQISTRKIDLSNIVGSMQIEEIFVGKKQFKSKKNLLVKGNGVGAGYFEYNQGDSLTSILTKLDFSDGIYPFFARIEQNEDDGLSRSIEFFSISDLSTAKRILLKNNPEITFFSREDISLISDVEIKEYLELTNSFIDSLDEDISEDDLSILSSVFRLKKDAFEEKFEIKNDLKIEESISKREELLKMVGKDFYKKIKIGDRQLDIPIVGNVSGNEIIEFFGTENDLILNDAFIASESSKNKLPLEERVDSRSIVSIIFPSIRQETISVEITGEVQYPGTYQIPSGFLLPALYEVAGGFLGSAGKNSILVFRESAKEREKNAVQSSRDVLKDALLGQLANPANLSSSAGNLDITKILELSENLEFSGRVTGNFSPDSDLAAEFALEDGDKIFVPTIPTTISVIGEVFNPQTTSFRADITFESLLESAGGFNEFADKKNIYIIRADGTSIKYNNKLFSQGTYPEPGDTLVVPRDLDKIDALPLVSIATKIISDISFAAASLNSIRN